MKKIISFMLTLMFLLSLAPSLGVKALDKTDLQKAIEHSKAVFGIPDSGYDFNYSYNENQNSRKTYDLNWTQKGGGNSSIRVSMDADTGSILSMNRWDGNDSSSIKIPKYSKERAREAAENFIKKIQPVEFSQTKFSDRNADGYSPKYVTYGNTYEFNYIRYYKNIPYDNNKITISLDKNTLKIMNYSFNWDKDALPDPSKAISLDAAKKIYTDKLGIELTCTLVYTKDNPNKPKPILVYSYKNGSFPIDALTGEVIFGNSGRGPYFDAEGATSLKASAVKPKLSPEELKSIESSKKYITVEKATEAVKQYVAIGNEYALKSSNLYTDNTESSSSWYLNWEYNDQSKGINGYINATVNAVTGDVSSFSIGGNYYDPAKDAVKKYTKTEGKNLAEAFLNKMQPDKFKMSEYREYLYSTVQDDKSPVYNYSYVQKQNGITCPSNNMSISVNAYTGQIMSYNANWSDIAVPSAEGIISLESAVEKFYSTINYSLRYEKIFDYSSGYDKSTVKLVYDFDNTSSMIDAKTGQPLDYSGAPLSNKTKKNFTDLKGTKYENDINILIDLGIIDTDGGKYLPNANIKQKDFIKMLVKSLSNSYYDVNSIDNDYNSYYLTAIQKKILTQAEKKPESYVTREAASKYIIRALNVGFVAGIDGIYKPLGSDASSISKGYTGYVTLSEGLRILNTENGKFNPKAFVKKGEGANIIVNSLKVDISK